MRIACISDLHLSGETGGWKNYDWMEYFLVKLEDWEVDHLIICGDIVAKYDDPADSDDFFNLRELLTSYGWYESKRCTIVPGNHDMRYMGNFPTIARSMRQIYPKLFRGQAKYNKLPYIITKVIGNVVIIGLDSVTDNPWTSFSKGYLDECQTDELLRILKLSEIKDKYIIIAMHHGPYEAGIATGHLVDYDEFWEVLGDDKAGDVNLIVHGHAHESFEEINGDIDIVCVGGSMRDDGEALIIDIDEENRGIEWWWLNIEEDDIEDNE